MLTLEKALVNILFFDQLEETLAGDGWGRLGTAGDLPQDHIADGVGFSANSQNFYGQGPVLMALGFEVLNFFRG